MSNNKEGVLIQLSIALAMIRNKLVEVHNNVVTKLAEHEPHQKKASKEYKELYSLMKSWADSVDEPLHVSDELKAEVDKIMSGQNA